MKASDALELIRGAVPRTPGTWADLGAGEGTFTRALAELLGPDSRIYAVDRDPGSAAALSRKAGRAGAQIIPVIADFSGAFDLPGLEDRKLDGALLANALHYVRDADLVLGRLAARLRPGGRLVLVEYDRRAANPWVPFPIPSSRLPALAASAGLSTPVILATRASAFGGNLYVAAADRLLPNRSSMR